MKNMPSMKKPRFSVGDRVIVVAADADSETAHKFGSVIDLVITPIDTVFRYQVRFADGDSEIFFGFELEPMGHAEIRPPKNPRVISLIQPSKSVPSVSMPLHGCQ